MNRKKILGIMLSAIIASTLSTVFNLPAVKAQGDPIYVWSDFGLSGNLTFRDFGLIVMRGGITINGNGYGLIGSWTPSSVGIFVANVDNVTIVNIGVTAFNTGICFLNSSYNSVYRSDASGNGIGIGVFANANNNLVRENIANYNTRTGIQLHDNVFNTVAANSAIENDRSGIELLSSHYDNITNNNSTLNDRSGIELVYSNYTSITGNNLTANDRYGIELVYSNYTSITGNNPTASDLSGIVFYLSTNNNIYRNNIDNNYDGIRIFNSSLNRIISNNITNNDYGVGDECGIWLYSSSNHSISGNNITANRYCGILVDSSNNNSISGNNIANNSDGVLLGSSIYNKIYHNNFINNTSQAYSDQSTNVWDDGYPSGGNYWNDYAGADLYSGPYQNEFGSDGIGDTPYFIVTDNRDRYPFMNYWLTPPKTSELVPNPITSITVMEQDTTWWDARGIVSPFVLYDKGIYKMWYSATAPLEYGPGSPKAIAYAESADGIVWSNKTVVHDYGLQEYYSATGYPWVMKEGGIYRMWHMDYYEWVEGDWSSYISHMSSVNGVNWVNETKVLSALGQSNSQGDGYQVGEPCVIYEPEIGYVMWYSVADHPSTGVEGPRKIWRAISNDGFTWSSRQLSLPYISNTWEGIVNHPSVVKEDDGTYTMFYGAAYANGSYPSIGIAESIDGIYWTNRRQLLRPSDIGVNITWLGTPSYFEDIDGKRYLYLGFYDESDGKLKFGRIQLGAQKPSLTTDLNKDGVVDIIDITIVASAFGAVPGDSRWDPRADLDGNRVVDIMDIAMVARDFGMTR